MEQSLVTSQRHQEIAVKGITDLDQKQLEPLLNGPACFYIRNFLSTAVMHLSVITYAVIVDTINYGRV